MTIEPVRHLASSPGWVARAGLRLCEGSPGNSRRRDPTSANQNQKNEDLTHNRPRGRASKFSNLSSEND